MNQDSDIYTRPAKTCPDPRKRPELDLKSSVSPEKLDELKDIEVESTWRGLPEDRHGRSRDGITMLCDIMGHGTEALVRKSLDLFGEEAFRVALHHANPGTISPVLWKYWHLRLHKLPPERQPPTMLSLQIASGRLPAGTPDPEPVAWP